MASKFKGVWLIVLLIAAGVVIFFLSLDQNKAQPQQGVVLQEIFNQKPVVNAMTAAPIKSAEEAAAKSGDPVPPMAIVISPENGHEAGFAIQVYSFQDKKRAESSLEALQNSGYKAFMVMTDLGEKGVWYRIRVGGIADEAAAHKMLEEIRKNYNSGFIVKPKK